DIQDYVNPQTDEYLIKSKIVGMNNLHTYVLISGFSVYFKIKINEIDDLKNIKVDYQKVKDVYCKIKNYQNAKVLDKTRVDLKGTPCVFMRVKFINHFKRKKEIQRLRNLIKEKKIDFELYEDDISMSYLMFISVRTCVKFLDSNKEVAFLLSGLFSTYSTLLKNMFSNIFHYSILMFHDEINNNHFLSIYCDLETVKMNQLRAMDHKLRKVPKGFKSDTAFMDVYCFFWGSEVKPFYIIAILLINDKFPIGYMNLNKDLVDLIEVRTQQEFLKTMFQIYKNFNPDKEKDLSIEEMYDIIIKCHNSEYDEGAKKERCNLILSYCIRDCQKYLSGNKTKMINNLIVDFLYREKRNLSVGYLKSERPKKKFTGGFREHRRKYHEVSFYDDLGNKYTSYFDKNKKGLIPVVLSLLVAQRKQAKRDRDYNKNNEFFKPSFFRNYMISSSVIAFGRDYLVKVSDFIKSRFVKKIEEPEFIWEYSDTNSIFISRNSYFINKIIFRYKDGLLKRDNSLEGFLKIFFKIVNDIVTESYKRYEKFEREINSWIGNESPKIVIEFEKLGIPIFYQSKKKYAMLMYTDLNYYFDNNLIGVEDYYKEKYGTWGNEDVIDEFIRNTDENIFLTCFYAEIDIYDENIWIKHVCSKLTEKFISYLYKRETELSMKLFEIMGRNNIEDNDKEILNTKKEDYDSDPQNEDEEDFEEFEDKDESGFDNNNELVLYENDQEIKDIDYIKNYIKENIKNSVGYLDDEKLIYKNEIDIEKERVREIEEWYLVDKDFIYKNTTLKQASFSNKGNKNIINFLNKIRVQKIKVLAPRFFYYILAINREKSVSNRMILVDQFDLKIHKINKYHYLKGIKSFLSVCLEMSEKKVEKILIDLINRYTNDVSMMNKYVSNSGGVTKKRKPKVDILVQKSSGYSAYVCLKTGYLLDKFPKNKNGGYSYKGFYSTIEASKFGTRIQQFNNQLKNRRDDKDPEYFVFNIFQPQKNKITTRTNISVHRLKDLNFRNSDLEFVDYVRSTNIDSFGISYKAILKLVKNEKYKDKNIKIIFKNIFFLAILRYKFYFWKRNNFKNGINMVTDGEDFDGLSNTELDEKMSEYSDHKDVEILNEIFLNMKKNNITIDSDLGFKNIPNIDFIFKKVKQNSKKIK
ncbi:32162_t:CDS:10, partial [Gigaspora margarita]